MLDSFPYHFTVSEEKTIKKNEGNNFTIECSTTGKPDALVLRVQNPFMQEVCTYDARRKHITVFNQYNGKVHYTGDIKKLTIGITNLQQKDSGVYMCIEIYAITSEEKEANRILLIVNDIKGK